MFCGEINNVKLLQKILILRFSAPVQNPKTPIASRLLYAVSADKTDRTQQRFYL